MRSPARTISPGWTAISSMMPETRGLISTSRRGRTEPVATAFLMMVVRFGVSVAKTSSGLRDLAQRK